MRYRIRHKTAYRYSEPASLSLNELFLQPRETASQKVIHYDLGIQPEPQYLRRRTDFFGNSVQLFMVQHPHDTLNVAAASIVETAMPVGPDPDLTPPWETVAGRLSVPGQQRDLDTCPFVFASPLVTISPAVDDFARPSFPQGIPVLAGAMQLMERIFTEFTYDKSATSIDTAVDQVLVARKGVCQDFAHLMISCLRCLGLPARYVSGYLETKPPTGKPKLIGADASHAWVSLYVPDAGWVDLDPTNNLMPGENHISLAWGRDYGDVTPVKGVVMGGGIHKLSVSVDVAQAVS